MAPRDKDGADEIPETDPFAGLELLEFGATPSTIEPGGSSTLHWHVTGAVGAIQVLLDGNPVSARGIREVAPTSDSVHRLDAVLATSRRQLGKTSVAVDPRRVRSIALEVEDVRKAIDTLLQLGIEATDQVRFRRPMKGHNQFGPPIPPEVTIDENGRVSVTLKLTASVDNFPDPNVTIDARFSLLVRDNVLSPSVEHVHIDVQHDLFGWLLKNALPAFLGSILEANAVRAGEATVGGLIAMLLQQLETNFVRGGAVPVEQPLVTVGLDRSRNAFVFTFGVDDIAGLHMDALTLAAPAEGRLFMAFLGRAPHTLSALEWDGAAWTRDADTATNVTSPPACAAAGNRLHMVARAREGTLVHRVREQGIWSDWVDLGGLGTSSPAVATHADGRVDVFVRGVDGGLWQRRFDAAQWSPWTNLGGDLTSSPAAIARAGGLLDVFARRGDRALWHRAFDGTAWSEWTSLGGEATSAPTVASWDAGRLDVLVRGIDFGLYHRGWHGQAWSEWQNLGGPLRSGPAATSWGADRIDVAARGDHGAILHRAWTGADWSDWSGISDGR